jgi:transposase-like protein
LEKSIIPYIGCKLVNNELELHCPYCKSKNLSIHDEIVECSKCKLTFTKKFLRELQDESILAEEEKVEFIRLMIDEEN